MNNKELQVLQGDVRIVNLPVRVLFRWSDEIVDDVDDQGKPVSFKSGWVMDVIGNESFVYKGHDTIHLWNTVPLDQKPKKPIT